MRYIHEDEILAWLVWHQQNDGYGARGSASLVSNCNKSVCSVNSCPVKTLFESIFSVCINVNVGFIHIVFLSREGGCHGHILSTNDDEPWDQRHEQIPLLWGLKRELESFLPEQTRPQAVVFVGRSVGGGKRRSLTQPAAQSEIIRVWTEKFCNSISTHTH